MKTTWNLGERSTGVLKVTVSGDVWTSAQEKAFNKLAQNVELPGFRKGQAPKALIRKQLKESSIMMEAVEAVANEAYLFGLKEHELNPITTPQLDVEGMSEAEVTLVFDVTVAPDVQLGEYKGLTVVRNEVAVEQADIDARLEKMREDFAELVIKEDGVVAMGDTAVIDFEGFKDGVAFDGGKGENHPLVIGSNSFIPGFEEQVVSMAVNEEKEISVTFPEDYGAANLAGAPVVFKVKVNEVKVRQVPELNDDFAKEINAPGVETFEELVEKLRMDIYGEKEKSAADAYDNDLLGKVVEASTVEIPAVMIEDETEAMFEDFKRRLEQQGFNIDMYSQITGQTQEFLKEQIGKDAEGKVKVRLVLSAVAKSEGLNATEEEIEQEFTSIAAAYNMEVDQVKQYIQPQQISYDLRLKKAFDFIKESANN